MIYIVTVHYALRIEADDMNHAQQIAESTILPWDNPNYIAGSFDVPDIHEANDAQELTQS